MGSNPIRATERQTLLFLPFVRKRSGPAEMRPGAEKRPKRRGLASRISSDTRGHRDHDRSRMRDGLIAFARGDVSPPER